MHLLLRDVNGKQIYVNIEQNGDFTLPKLTARSQVFGANTIQRPAAYLNMTFDVG